MGFPVGVDPIGECQVHQYGSCQGTRQIGLEGRDERTVLVITKQEENFFGIRSAWQGAVR